VTHPIVEIRAFLRAALVSPVPGIAEDPPESRPRRRWVAAATLLVGAVLLAAWRHR
jgi:hypothetical protein